MIEKYYKKYISLTAPRSAYARVANHFLKDYEEVNETTTIPADIQAAAEKIKNGVEIELDDFGHKSVFSFNGYGRRDYDESTYEIEYHYSAYFDTDENGEPAYLVEWYFFTNSRYKKRIADKIVYANDYLDIIKKNYELRGKYRYFCRHRPPSPGAIPDGYVFYETYRQGSEEIGEVTYNERLSDEECQKYGLKFDEEYERARVAYLGIQGAADNGK